MGRFCLPVTLVSVVVLSFPGCLIDLPKSPLQDFSDNVSVGDGVAGRDKQGTPDGVSNDPGFDSWQWSPDSQTVDDTGGRGNSENPEFDLDLAAAEVEALWECVYTPQELSTDFHEYSFFATSQQMEADLLYVYGGLCGLSESNFGPERVYLLEVDLPRSLNVRVDCSSSCLAYLMRNGCNYIHTQGCWYGESGSVQFSADLMSGTYILAVEILVDEEVLEPGAGDFDIHVAVNNSHGQEDCSLEDDLAFSDLETQCDGNGKGLARGVLDGTLSWDYHDLLFTGCSQSGALADEFGGMPDLTFAFVADFEEEESMPLTVRLSVPDQPWQPIAEHLLAITTDPCGAEDAVVDCKLGAVGQLVLEDLVVFRGETVYAVVDGIGEAGFDFPDMPFELSFEVPATCPD